MSTEVSVDVDFQIVTVGPISFPATVNAVSRSRIEEWKSDLRLRHPGLKDIVPVQGYEIDSRLMFVRTVQVIMDEDADYQQICSLRAELKKDLE